MTDQTPVDPTPAEPPPPAAPPPAPDPAPTSAPPASTTWTPPASAASAAGARPTGITILAVLAGIGGIFGLLGGFGALFVGGVVSSPAVAVLGLCALAYAGLGEAQAAPSRGLRVARTRRCPPVSRSSPRGGKSPRRRGRG